MRKGDGSAAFRDPLPASKADSSIFCGGYPSLLSGVYGKKIRSPFKRKKIANVQLQYHQTVLARLRAAGQNPYCMDHAQSPIPLN